MSVRRAAADEVIPLRWRVLRPGRPAADARWDGDLDEDASHYVLEEAGAIVAVCTVLSRPFPLGEGPGRQLRGMAVDETLRGAGLGGRLLQAVMGLEGGGMWCNARLRAARFYLERGWEAIGGEFELPGIGPHLRLRTRAGAEVASGRRR